MQISLLNEFPNWPFTGLSSVDGVIVSAELSNKQFCLSCFSATAQALNTDENFTVNHAFLQLLT